MESTDRKSWFASLSVRQRVFVIAVPLLGLVGGVVVLMAEPEAPVGFAVMIFALVLLGKWVPRLRAWIGTGFQLYMGIGGVFMGLSGQLETLVARALSLIVGVSLLIHLLVRGFLLERGIRKTRRTAA
ncbi:hypothetical protein [Nonomuraea sp. CA-141351]|uniref:hypothetical protein n=1 Tax=Nonomuraea sp. CA-141351 TaxID=3239996 RepID=UPI003D8BFBAB